MILFYFVGSIVVAGLLVYLLHALLRAEDF
jgi:K+-transporting ATPase KdpF subunit